MPGKEAHIDLYFKKRGIYDILHIIILLLSIFLVVVISVDTFRNEPFYEEPKFSVLQFWICIIFLFDFFVEFILAPSKWKYMKTRFLFLLVSIPYNSIISHYHLTFNPQVTYCLQFIPLIRGGYAMAIVVSWFTYNRATGLFISYLSTLLFTVYFASLAFYLFEHQVNPGVSDYDDALWWAFMDATTVGSNIVAVTTVGRILSVLLAALGMMMFPIFTVYVTNILTRHNQQGKDIENMDFSVPIVRRKGNTLSDNSTTSISGSQDITGNAGH